MKSKFLLAGSVLLVVALVFSGVFAEPAPKAPSAPPPPPKKIIKQVPAVYEVVSPVGELAVEKKPLSPRVTDLNGKTIFLLDNRKEGAFELLAAIKGLLQERFKGLKFVEWRKGYYSDVEPKLFEAAAKCDVAITAIAD